MQPEERVDTEVQLLRPMSDGVVTIRPPIPGDSAKLIAGRDSEWRRWLGPGDDDPHPTACILVAGEVVGWVDADPTATHLQPGEVNVGYNVFAPHRGKGYASRAVELLIQYLRESTPFHTASLSIDSDNAASLAVAARTGFVPSGDPESKSLDFKRAVRRDARP
jgi:RimJ/RimL family protein N-acetyltransferase